MRTRRCESRGEPRLHRVLGAHVVRDRGDRGGRPVAGEEEAEPFGEHACLARARGRDHACRAAVVHDRFELVGREVGVGRGGTVQRELALLDRVAVHDRARVAARSAVAPRVRAVGQRDVGVVAGCRPQPPRFDRRSPHEALAPAVVVVRPREEVRALPCELEVRVECVRRARVGLRRAQLLDIDPQLDDDRLPVRPRVRAARRTIPRDRRAPRAARRPTVQAPARRDRR